MNKTKTRGTVNTLTDEGPWAQLDEAGTDLTVDDFLTTVTDRTASALRRAITGQYVGRFELTIPEWRLLSVLAQVKEMTFPDLVMAAVVDKAQVSRTLRRMQDRGLVTLNKEGSNPRWQVILCRLTTDGMALYRQAMPAAQRAQAAMIRKLAPDDRKTVYRAMQLLRRACEAEKPSLDEGS